MSDDPKTPQEGIPLSTASPSTASSATGATEGVSDLGALRDDPVCGPLLEQLEALDLKDEPPDPYETAEVLSPNPGGLIAPAGRNVARAQLDIAAPSPKDPSAGADDPACPGPAGSDKVVIKDGSPPAAVDVLQRLPSGHVDAPTVVDRSRRRAHGPAAAKRQRDWLWLVALALGAFILIGLVSRWATHETVAACTDPSATTVPVASGSPAASSAAPDRSAAAAEPSAATSAGSAAAPSATQSTTRRVVAPHVPASASASPTASAPPPVPTAKPSSTRPPLPDYDSDYDSR